MDTRETFRRYAIGVCSVAAGLAVRWALAGVLGSSVPYATLYPAVVIAAAFGGLGPGILATCLSLGAVFYFVTPRMMFAGDAARALLFVAFSILFSIFNDALRRAKARSERDRDLLRITLSSIGDAVISTGPEGKVTFMNGVAEELTGWPQQDAAGKAISEVFIVTDAMLRSRNGREIPVEHSAAPIGGAQGRALGTVLVFRDVTAQREAEAAASRSEERWKLALDAGQIGVWDWDMAQNRIDLSDQVYELFGIERGTLAIRDLASLVHPEDREAVNRAVRAAIHDGAPYVPEFRVIHPQKGIRWMANLGQVIRNEKGEAVRMLGSVSDITERKQAEAQLRQQWHTFDTVLSNTPDFNYVFDLEGRFTYANRARLLLLQKTREEVLGKNFHELGYPPELADRFMREIRQVIEAKEPVRGESPFTAPSGVTREYEYIFVPLLSAQGQVEAVVGTTHDITERKVVEERLRTSEERLTFALEAGGGVGTWDWDVANDRVYTNRRMATFHSVDAERAAQGVSITEFVNALHVDDRERARASIQEALDTGGDFEGEFRVAQKDGSVRWIYDRGRCHLDEAGKPTRFPGVSFDITDRKHAEEALRESQDRLRATYEGMYEYMGLLSIDGIVLDCNPASLRFAENSREDVLGRPFWETPWFTATPGMPEIVREAVSRVAAGDSLRTEMTWIRPSGEARTFDFSMHPIRNERGEVVMMVPEGRDITGQKRAEEELKRSNEELTRVNRELEEFAYVASHDLQEPLRMVNIYTQLILDEIDQSPPDIGQYAAFVQEGVRRMEGLIHDLLTFSRAVHSDSAPVGNADLSAALSEAVSVLKNRIQESGCVIAAEPLPTVRGDVSQMAHVFQNLLSNALKYCKRGVPPAIQVSAKREGAYWVIAIRDHGIGFEPRYAERIFGLFKRLYKEEYPGTGLGLAICKRIVERYGGRIWAEGNPGEGATFYFSLPAAE